MTSVLGPSVAIVWHTSSSHRTAFFRGGEAGSRGSAAGGGGEAREGLVQPFRPDRPSLLPTPTPLPQNLPADPERAEKGRALGQEQEPAAVARGSPGPVRGESLMRTD